MPKFFSYYSWSIRIQRFKRITALIYITSIVIGKNNMVVISLKSKIFYIWYDQTNLIFRITKFQRVQSIICTFLSNFVNFTQLRNILNLKLKNFINFRNIVKKFILKITKTSHRLIWTWRLNPVISTSRTIK